MCMCACTHPCCYALLPQCKRFDHVLRVLPPDVVRPFAQRVDLAVVAAAEECGAYPGALGDDITLARVRLSPHMRGLGLRPLAEVADGAYAASFVEAAQSFFGPRGLFPMLADVFQPAAQVGVVPADSVFAADGPRFAHCLAVPPQTPSLEAFSAAWLDLQLRVGVSGVAGPLDLDVERAGAGTGRHLQRAITHQWEQAERDALHLRIAALPRADTRREAWFSADELSRQWVTTWPSPACAISEAEFGEVFTTYLGRESPVCRALAGQAIACGRGARVCDAFGVQLGLATLPGGAHTSCHEECAEVIFGVMGIASTVVREPRHLFSSVVPPVILMGPGRPLGVVPDARASLSLPRDVVSARRPAGPEPRRSPAVHREWVFDVKTIHGGGGAYLTARARDEQSGGVLERAHHVASDYLSHARRIDARLHGGASAAAARAGRAAPPPSTAVADRLRVLGPVRPLVFGQYGEASPDVHAVIAAAAAVAARDGWARMGARTEAEARGFFAHVYRRRVGVGAVRAFARHRLGRVSMVGAPSAMIRAPARALQPAVRSPMEFYAYQAYAPPQLGGA